MRHASEILQRRIKVQLENMNEINLLEELDVGG